MKKLFATITLLLSATLFFAETGETPKEAKKYSYISRCNFALGCSFVPYNDFVEIEEQNISFSVTDIFNDSYGAKYNTTDFQQTKMPLSVAIQFPVFYTKNENFFSTGIKTDLIGFYTGLTDFLIDIYMQKKINRNFDIEVFSGVGIFMSSKEVGSVKANWQGDPGYYKNGKFYKTGTTIDARGTGNPQFNIGTSFKVRPLKYKGFFISFDYRYITSSTCDELKTELGLDSTSVSRNKVNIHINDTHNLGVAVGWGF